MSKLSQREYLRIFAAISNLYGLADETSINEIIDHYYDGVNKSDTLLALKKFNEKNRKKGFRVEKRGDEGYMLISELLEDEMDVARVISIASKSSFYFPPSKEEFLDYEKDFNCDEEENLLYGEFTDFIYKHHIDKGKGDGEAETTSFFLTLYLQSKIKSSGFDYDVVDLLEHLGFVFKSKYTQKKLMKMWVNLLFNTRLFIHRGHKVSELEKRDEDRMEEELDHLNRDAYLSVYGEDEPGEKKAKETKNKRNSA